MAQPFLGVEAHLRGQEDAASAVGQRDHGTFCSMYKEWNSGPGPGGPSPPPFLLVSSLDFPCEFFPLIHMETPDSSLELLISIRKKPKVFFNL